MPELVLTPLCRSVEGAESFALIVHADQTDKVGQPYTEHLRRVAGAALQTALLIADADYEAVEQIAYLHDVIEDTPYDAAHLRREGFSEEVVAGVQWLTKTGNEPYQDWIDRLCAEAPLPVLIVKLADIEDNSDPERLSKLDEATQARLRKKYEPALVKLRAAIEERAGRTPA